MEAKKVVSGHIPSTFPTCLQGHHEHSNVPTSLRETLDVLGVRVVTDLFLPGFSKKKVLVLCDSIRDPVDQTKVPSL